MDNGPAIAPRVWMRALLIVAMLAPSVANADERGRPATRPEVVATSYGGQTLAADAIAVGVFLGGAVATSPELVVGAAVIGGVGPASVHGAHGNFGAALGGAALRASLLTVGAYVGASAADCDTDFCSLGEAVVGGAVGYAVAAIVDARFLAQTNRVVRRPWVAPSVSPSAAGVQAGIVGAF